jgi:hypothetical protein
VTVLNSSGSDIDALENTLLLVRGVFPLGIDVPQLVLVTAVRSPPSSARTRTTRNTPASGAPRARRDVKISYLDLADGKSSAIAGFTALIDAEVEVSSRKGQALGARLARNSVTPLRPLRLRVA